MTLQRLVTDFTKYLVDIKKCQSVSIKPASTNTSVFTYGSTTTVLYQSDKMTVVSNRSRIHVLFLLFLSHHFHIALVHSFSPSHRPLSCRDAHIGGDSTSFFSPNISPTVLFAENGESSSSLTDTDATVLAIAGIGASSIMLYSESVLFQTGCGLPAGPYGLVGAIEGVSYLGTAALLAYSLYTKFQSGKGLPKGPGGGVGSCRRLGLHCNICRVLGVDFASGELWVYS